MINYLGMIAPAVVVVVILIIALFSPGLLPIVGRMLGKLLRKEIKRKTGLSIPADKLRTSRQNEPEPVVQIPVEPAFNLESPLCSQPEPIAAQDSSRSRIAIWTAGSVAVFAILAWWLFHSR